MRAASYGLPVPASIDSSFGRVRHLRLSAANAAQSEKPGPVNRNFLRALVVTTIAALIPLHANIPDNFSPSSVVSAGRLTVDSTQAALNDVFARLNSELARGGVSAFRAERAMTFSQLMNRWNGYVAEAAARFKVPAAWLRAVMRQESGGRTMLGERQPIVSRAGAVGLMQLMPATYEQMRRTHSLGANPADPHDNIMAAAAYLRWLHDKYGFPAMFAAYNAGPGKLENHVSHGAALPLETINYVASIMGARAALGGLARPNLTKLTRPNGKPVFVDGAAVVTVEAALPGEYPRGTRAVVQIGRARQGVRETVNAVKTAIRARGGFV